MPPIVTPPDDSRPAPRGKQLRRTRGWRKPADGRVVTRPGRFGNPFRVRVSNDPADDASPAACAAAFEDFLQQRRAGIAPPRWLAHYPSDDEIRAALAGHDLYCWCAEGDPCHRDTLLCIANGPAS